MKPIYTILLTYCLLLATCIGCHKNKVTRATPKFSLKYNGVYTESNDASVKFRKVLTPDNTYQYYIAPPIEDSYLQLWMDTLYTGYSQTLTHTGMVWTFSSYYFGQIDINFTSVTTTATGTFSGAMWNTVNSDTVFITDGTFLNINYD